MRMYSSSNLFGLLCSLKNKSSRDKRDVDIIREEHRYVDINCFVMFSTEEYCNLSVGVLGVTRELRVS